MERTLAEFRRARALSALRAAQEESVRNGTDALSPDEINAEIAAARKSRRARAAK
jgi:hypothetical protein